MQLRRNSTHPSFASFIRDPPIEPESSNTTRIRSGQSEGDTSLFSFEIAVELLLSTGGIAATAAARRASKREALEMGFLISKAIFPFLP
jgi:hypothetical protein